jgi:CheY-like chemotaxis protein
LAEDNEINQHYVKTILESKFEVEIAPNGLKVLELLEKNTFHLILMDLHMPEMDGYETTEIIRNLADKKLKNIPIVALTAAAIKGEKEKCLAAGMDDYLSKPFDPKDLFQIIAQNLKIKVPEFQHTDKPNQETPADESSETYTYVNLDYLHSIGQGDNKFKNDLIDIFREQIPKLAEQLKKALEDKEYTELSAIAHKAKSSVAMLGIVTLKSQMETLENKAREAEEPETYAQLVNDFCTISEQVLNEIKDLKF